MAIKKTGFFQLSNIFAMGMLALLLASCAGPDSMGNTDSSTVLPAATRTTISTPIPTDTNQKETAQPVIPEKSMGKPQLLVSGLDEVVKISTPAPRLIPPRLEEKLPDFTAIENIAQKKSKFFRYLLAHVQIENRRIEVIRNRIKISQTQIAMAEPLCLANRQWLLELAADYGLSARLNPDDATFYSSLLRMVDILPASLVLAQGANESGWGQSRFAREGNNLFGEWCFMRGCGLVPLRRPEGQKHEVASFASVSDSVRAYFYNINTNPAYKPLRKLREELHQSGQPITGLALGQMLTPYSQLGQAYVEAIQSLIRVNRLSRYDSLLSAL